MMGSRQSTLDFMTAGIRTACRRFRGRCAGSEAERRCQQYFRRLLAPWCDTAALEPFTLASQGLPWMAGAGRRAEPVLAGPLLGWASAAIPPVPGAGPGRFGRCAGDGGM